MRRRRRGAHGTMCGLLCGHVRPRVPFAPRTLACAGMCGRPLWGVRVCAGEGRVCRRACAACCADVCGHVRPRAALGCRAATNGAMCRHVRCHVRGEPEPAALAWAPNASPKRRPYCTRVSAHATHMGAQSQTSSHGEDRMGTSVKNSKHMPPHMPAHTRASMDRCAPTAGTPAHAGHMPRTCPHNERTCRTKNAGT